MRKKLFGAVLSVCAGIGMMAVPAMADNEFVPSTAARKYLGEIPESVEQRMNDDGQLPVGEKYLYCSGEWQSIGLEDDGAAMYPALAARMEELNKAFEENGNELLEATWKGGELAIEAGLNEDDTYVYYTSGADLLMCRSDDAVVSFMRHDKWFGGNLYNQDRKTGWSIDPRSGEDLKVSDVFTDPQAALDILKADLEEYYSSERSPELYPKLEQYFNGEEVDGITMTVGYENVVFYIAPEVATTNETVVEILPYSRLGDAVNAAYTGHQTDYVTDVICDSYFTGEFSADLNGDGTAVYVNDFASLDEYGTITEMVLISGGNTMSYPLYGYSLQTRLIRTEDGRYYLYTDSTSDNDWHETYVVKYENGEWVYVDAFEGSIESRYEYETKPWLMIDPEAFRVEKRAQTLSTVGIWQGAKVGADGIPEYAGAYWNYSFPFTLTLKMDLEAEMTDEEGNITGRSTLAAGTVLTMYRTDTAGVEDLKDSSGNIYRLYLNAEDWPRTVNGIELEELFDGVIFAG